MQVCDYLIFDEETGTYVENPEQMVRDDVEKHHWLNVARTVLKDWRLYLMLIPMIFVFLCWRYFPMYELLGCFKNGDTRYAAVADQPFVGFAFFNDLMFGGNELSAEFWRAFRNTFLLSFYGLLFGFPMPIIIALFFNEVRSNVARSFLQVATYLPKFMSTVVMTSLITMLVSPARYDAALVGNMPNNPELNGMAGEGIITQLLENLGVVQRTVWNDELGREVMGPGMIGLLRQPQFFRAIYQVSGIWEGAGYDSIVFFAAIIAISPTSYEAAQIDGAGKMSQMRYVVIPSILSTIVIMLITRIGSLLNVGYEKVLLLQDTSRGNDIYQTAEIVSTFAQRKGIPSDSGGSQPNPKNKGWASAAEMMNNVIGMLLVIGANTVARRASDVSLY